MESKNKTSTRKTGVLIGVGAAAAVAIAAFAGAQGAIPIPGMDFAEPARPAQAAMFQNVAFQPPGGAPISFADIFEQVSPAVVAINVRSEVSTASLEIPGAPPGFRLVPPNGGAPRTREAEGSGFFISPDGYIVTNNHVVADATEIHVTLSDERELEATVIGTDPSTDLAVLKVDGGNYPFVNFENTADPRVGDWVIAIGNPFGLGSTATVGIVSAEGRRTTDQASTFVDFLQIDAAINSGNSGGPTFDVHGRVIGVNSSILSPTGGSVGIGFAIPADVAEAVANQLISEGRVTRGFLGARIMAFNEEFAAGQNVDFDDYGGGAYIVSVTPDGPADRAGLRAGDVVLELNGREVEDQTELTRMVANTRSGDTMRLRVLRQGEIREFEVRSGTRPDENVLASNDRGEPDEGGRGSRERPAEPDRVSTSLGIMLGPIDQAARDRYQLDGDVQGAVIEGVESEDPVVRQLQRGDVITMAGGAPVSRPEDVVAAIEAQQNAGRDSILLLLQRDGNPAPITIDIPEEKRG